MAKQLLKKAVIFILTLEARLVLRKYKPQIVAVTGSVGKTATKDAIATILEGRFFVRKSEKSFNSEIGVPLTILGCQNGWDNVFAWMHILFEGLALIFLENHYPKILVLEVGTDRPGDIKKIARFITPDIVVVTRFGEVPVHVEFFKSREELIDEKKNLIYALRAGGKLVLNADDEDVRALGNERRDVGEVITFGVLSTAVCRISHIELSYGKNKQPKGVRAKIQYKGKIFPLAVEGTIGEHYISVALAAVGVGLASGMNIVDILEHLTQFKVPPGRMRTLSGIKGTFIVDDTYNSSPAAAEAALRSFQKIEYSAGRRIAVLGDMLELGKQSIAEHERIGALAAHVVDVLVTVGLRAKIMHSGAYDEGMKVENIYHFESAKDAGVFLREFLFEGDFVLVKGSQSMRMERAVEAIIVEPDRKKELLVRQEKEWQER